MQCIFLAGVKCPSMVNPTIEEMDYEPTDDEIRTVCQGSYRLNCPRYDSQMDYLKAIHGSVSK